MKHTYLVEKREQGKSLLSFVKEKLNLSCSNKKIKSAIDKGMCKINGKIERFASKKLQRNDQVEVEDAFLNTSKLVSLKILFEDKDLLIIDKPVDMVCDDVEIHKHYPKSYTLIHRLDKGTSGVLLIAKSFDIKQKMIQLFKEKKVFKKYVAVVDGFIEKETGVIEDFLEKKTSPQGAFVVSSNKGQKAVTEYKVLERKKTYSLVLCMPITGRTHQIRVHMKKIGHPILGDYQ
ncbi:MAG TPA: RluA family pseudouridine synthase, partial [Chlamydiales bacterium]|nr:RluA family pseudouridine synthase [Chlamydiales bacterium]